LLIRRFVANYGFDENYKDEGVCSNFVAGDNIRTEKKSAKLDETAIFGAACRHGFPKLFCNLKHCERYSYPVYIIKKLLEEESVSMTPDDDHLLVSTDIVIMYDIACKFKAHLRKNDFDVLNRIRLTIPAFHKYGHGLDCQIKFDPRGCTGIGLTELWNDCGPIFVVFPK